MSWKKWVAAGLLTLPLGFFAMHREKLTAEAYLAYKRYEILSGDTEEEREDASGGLADAVRMDPARYRDGCIDILEQYRQHFSDAPSNLYAALHDLARAGDRASYAAVLAEISTYNLDFHNLSNGLAPLIYAQGMAAAPESDLERAVYEDAYEKGIAYMRNDPGFITLDDVYTVMMAGYFLDKAFLPEVHLLHGRLWEFIDTPEQVVYVDPRALSSADLFYRLGDIRTAQTAEAAIEQINTIYTAPNPLENYFR